MKAGTPTLVGKEPILCYSDLEKESGFWNSCVVYLIFHTGCHAALPRWINSLIPTEYDG